MVIRMLFSLKRTEAFVVLMSSDSWKSERGTGARDTQEKKMQWDMNTGQQGNTGSVAAW